MAPSTLPDQVPLAADEHGVVRVGGTRVTLDQIVGPFLQGATPEEIALRHSSLQLADIYATIAHYLRHREEVDAYLGQEAQAAEEVRERHAERVDVSELRARLLARQRG